MIKHKNHWVTENEEENPYKKQQSNDLRSAEN